MRTCGSPPNRASSSGPRNSAQAARSCKVAWPGRCSARSPPGSGAVRSSTAGGSSRTSGPVDVLAKAVPFPGEVPLALPSPHRRRPNRLATDMTKTRGAERHRAWRKCHYPSGHSHVHREHPREPRACGPERDSLSAAARKRTARRPGQPDVGFPVLAGDPFGADVHRCESGRNDVTAGFGESNTSPGLPLIHRAAAPRLCPTRYRAGCCTPRCSTGRQLESPWALLGSGAGDFGADPGAARVRTIHVEVAVERLYPVR